MGRVQWRGKALLGHGAGGGPVFFPASPGSGAAVGLQWQDSAPCCPSLAGVALPVAGIAPVQRRVVSGQRGVLRRARGRLKKEAAITAGGALCRAGGRGSSLGGVVKRVGSGSEPGSATHCRWAPGRVWFNRWSFGFCIFQVRPSIECISQRCFEEMIHVKHRASLQ